MTPLSIKAHILDLDNSYIGKVLFIEDKLNPRPENLACYTLKPLNSFTLEKVSKQKVLQLAGTAWSNVCWNRTK